MALRPSRSQAQQFASLLSKHEPAIRQAFMRAVVDLQANVNHCAAPAIQYQAGDVLSVDGVRVNILSVQRIPEAGTTVAVKFIIRG